MSHLPPEWLTEALTSSVGRCVETVEGQSWRGRGATSVCDLHELTLHCIRVAAEWWSWCIYAAASLATPWS